MRIALDDVELAVPAGWEDHTVLTVLGPAPAPTVKMKPGTPPPERPSFVVKRVSLTAPPVDLETFALAQERMMQEVVKDLADITSATLELGAHKAVTREWTFAGTSGSLRQIQLYVVVDRTFFVMCGTATHDLNWSGAREGFVSLARAARLGSRS